MPGARRSDSFVDVHFGLLLTPRFLVLAIAGDDGRR
jgi:hypothetical protein